MAFISKLIPIEYKPKKNTTVVAGYCFNENLFQIRSYKSDDYEMKIE